LNVLGGLETCWFGMDKQAASVLFKVIFIITVSLGLSKSA